MVTMPYTKLKGYLVQEKSFLKGFYHTQAWQLSWSMEQNHMNMSDFTPTMNGLSEIWLKSAQHFQSKYHLKMRIHANLKSK